MPRAPECQGRGIIRHATQHVFHGIDIIRERPEPEEAPWNHEFEPNDVEVEVSNHGELEGSVVGEGAVGRGFRDGDNVDEMEN